MDLRERLAELAAKNDEPLPAETPHYSDEEAKEAFLEFLAFGIYPEDAARKVGRTATWFRRRRNPKSRNYDADLDFRYDEIMGPNGEHRASVVEATRAAMFKSALEGNVRAQEKILMAYDPDFEFLRPSQWQGDTYNVERLVQVVFPDLPTHVLEQLIAHEEAKRKELPVVEQ